MSHFTTIETQMTDTEALVDALCEMRTRTGRALTRADIQVHATPQALLGYKGDTRTQTAEIVLRGRGWERNGHAGANVVGGASNDIGFYKTAAGTYAAHISENEATYYGKKWQSDLAQRYAVNVVKRTLPYGYQLHEEQQANGEVFVTVTSSY